LVVDYRKTPRNGAAVKMLEELGFEYRPGGENAGTFARPLHLPIADDDVVETVDLTAARELSV
jgi:hypothetical protein